MHAAMAQRLQSVGAQHFSVLAISDSLKQLAVSRWYKKNVVAGVKDLS